METLPTDLPVRVFLEDAFEYAPALLRCRADGLTLFGPQVEQGFGKVDLVHFAGKRLPSRSIFARWSEPWLMNLTRMWWGVDKLGHQCLLWSLHDGIMDSCEFIVHCQDVQDHARLQAHVQKVFGDLKTLGEVLPVQFPHQS